MRSAILACLTLIPAGCTTAGPFVTSVSSDGRGNLVVEKSMVKYNGFMGTVSNEMTTTTTIKVCQGDQAVVRRGTIPNLPPDATEDTE
jgi:hypothetical protein